MPGARDGVAIPGVVCMGCGYDVRGLGVDAVCPECAASVRGSVMHAQLQTPRLSVALRAAVWGFSVGAVVVTGFLPALEWILSPQEVRFIWRRTSLPLTVCACCVMIGMAGLLLLVELTLRRHRAAWIVALGVALVVLGGLPALGRS
jgi:hypothetical protein